MTAITAKEHRDSKTCQLHVGTSGFSYAEWVDAGFYPSGTKSGKMLQRYAQCFLITELNYTWYQMPKVEAIERQCQQVPQEFLFAAKLTRTLTHEIDQQQWRHQAVLYREGIVPLVQAGQLVAVLIQLPPRSSAQHQTENTLQPCSTSFMVCPWQLSFDIVPGPAIVCFLNWNAAR